MTREQYESTSKAQIARDLIKKFPHQSKRELGKMLYKLNPAVFKDEEDGRYHIRGVTHSIGKNRITAKAHEYKGLPKGIKNDFTPHVLKPGKYGILSDVHIPYHDEKAIQIALDRLNREGIKNIILNGDIIDCYQLSRFEKIPSLPSIKEEFQMFRDWLTYLSKHFNVVYKLGNHCERWEKYMLQKAPELFDLEILSWDFMIHQWWNLPKVQIVNNKRIMTAGKLNIMHSHEFGNSIFSPVNPARGFFLRAKANVLGSHHHQTSEHIERDLNGKIIGTWSIGCLCDLQPQYMPINKWNHGFAIVEHDGEDFEVLNLKIINGKVR